MLFVAAWNDVVSQTRERQVQVEIGDTVVYPHHGAATVTAVKTRMIKGTEAAYVSLRVHSNDLMIELPVAKFDDVGVRDVINAAGVEGVYAVLRADVPEDLSNWSRRYKANQEKLVSGDVVRAAEVVRDLWRRDVIRGVSTGEKAMLIKARHIVESELALALNCTQDKAAAVVTGVLEENLPS